MKAPPITLRIGGLIFTVSIDAPDRLIDLGPNYAHFVASGDPDVTILAKYDGVPDVALSEMDRLFDSEGIWSLYRGKNGRHTILLRSPRCGPGPYRVAVFDADFRRGVVYSRPPAGNSSARAPLPNPLEYPLSEVLMICLLAQGWGLMVHACGVDDGGRGFLFCGNSGHGKTTMSRLWKDQAVILNDDRIILRAHEGAFWMYGTPWHGDYSEVSPKTTRLERVFFLRHDRANHASPQPGAAAVSMLVTRSFLPLWDGAGTRFSLDFAAQVASSVPCRELGFVPDRHVLDFVRALP